MAQQGTVLRAWVLARLLHLRGRGVGVRETARLLGVSTSTVAKYTAMERAKQAG